MRGPQGEWRDAAERVAAILELIEVIAKDLPRLTSLADLMPRQFAALGLARCLRIVDGMHYLQVGGHADVMDAYGRSVIEVYALSMYSLWGGADAYEHIRGSHVRDIALLPDTPEFERARSLGDRWPGRTDKIKWEQLITKTLPGLVPDGESANGALFHDWLYNLMYRGYSTRGVHASVQSIALHLVRRGGIVGVQAARYEPDDGTGHLLIAGSLMAILATNVYSVFGLDTSRVRALADVIGSDMDEDALMISGDWEGLE